MSSDSKGVQRKKEEEEKKGGAYLKKESTRVLNYYVPAAELPEKERRKKNVIAKGRNQKHRDKRKAQQRAQDESSGYESFGSPLIVKLPFRNPSAGRSSGGKKYSRALSRAHKSLKSLQNEKQKYFKKYRAKLRQCERLKKKLSMARPTNSSDLRRHTGTPNSKTDAEMRGLDLTPRRAERVRRKLLMKKRRS